MRALVAVLLLVLPALGAPVPKEVKRAEKLDGLWAITAMETFGRPQPVVKQHWRIEGDKLTVERLIVGDATPRPRPSIAIKVDASTIPKSLDYNTGRAAAARLAIYEVDGDTLRILMAASRVGERPKEMKADDRTMLYTFKRVKE